MGAENRQWILTRRPVGEIRDGDLEMHSSPMPRPGPGEILVRTRYLSMDPTNRIWMSDMDQYMAPVALGAPMRGVVCGEVLASDSDRFKPGDSVMGLGTWSDYCCLPAANFTPLPELADWSPKEVFAHLCIVGPTAYFGLVDIGAPKIGETLVVSGAAGAVGSIVGQLGKALGCRVVGIAGGSEKCEWLTRDLQFDAAIDYRSGELKAGLERACPEGIDVYFDNVGGQILDAVMGMMNLFGRIIECGMIAGYNQECRMPGPDNYPRILMKRLRVQGFIVLDYAARYQEAYRALARLRAQGRLKWREHEIDDLRNADRAARLLYRGENLGKLLVRVS